MKIPILNFNKQIIRYSNIFHTEYENLDYFDIYLFSIILILIMHGIWKISSHINNKNAMKAEEKFVLENSKIKQL